MRLRTQDIITIVVAAVTAMMTAAGIGARGLLWLSDIKTDVAVLKHDVAEIRAYVKPSVTADGRK